MAESIMKISTQSKTVVNNPDLHESLAKVIPSKMGELEDQFKYLLSLTKKRQVVLEDSLSFYQLIQVWKNYFHYSIKNTFLCFFQVFEEEGQWYDKKLAVCSATITAKDLRALISLQ